MAISSDVCKTILDANDVTQLKLGEELMNKLVSTGKITREEAHTVHQELQKVLNEQTNALIDRVLKIL